MTMTINIENCVKRLGCRDGHGRGRRYMVEQMVMHLRQLRDAAMAGAGEEWLEEFFSLYTFSDNVKYVPYQPKEPT